MRYDLFDYQREAALDVLKCLARGRTDWTQHGSHSAFALNAITAAGKTVIATAVIEATLHGSSDLGVDRDGKAAFLWVTDDPALNRQTLNRMLDASDLLQHRQLVILDNDFDDDTLRPGMVYFLNIQKLSKRSGLAQGGVDKREHSMWDVLARTIASDLVDLYVVLDEAHRGMTPASDRKPIVQRIISGQPGANPPVPVVWGISATVARFTKAMEGARRTRYEDVEVDVERVRASGLIKDVIGIDEPDEKGAFSSTLLRDAIQGTLDYDRRWSAYSTLQNEPPVLPILVVQVPDKASKAKLADIVTTINAEWPGLGPDAIVNVFGEHDTLAVAGRQIAWMSPEGVQGANHVRIVLAKEAISTGWDCPRAEVLYSERPAQDATHIAQVIGRMVRQPLARRIPTDDTLNSVACFLPLFNRSALSAIKAELEGAGRGNGDNRVSADVVRCPHTFGRNPGLSGDVFTLIHGLPSVAAPDPLAHPLRRAKQLAKLLADDASGAALLPNALEVLTQRLNRRLDGLDAEHRDEVASHLKGIETAQVRTSKVTPTGTEIATDVRTEATHVRDMDRDARRMLTSVKEGVAKDYYAYRVGRAGAEDARLDVKLQVAALLQVSGVVAELEKEATRFVRENHERFAVEISNTTGAARDAYRKVREQASEREVATVDLRDNENAATKGSKGNDLERYPSHLFCDEHGGFPADLNDWEEPVLTTELHRPSFVAWYRNPQRPGANALRIAYQNDAGHWTSLQVDFLVVSRRDDGQLAVSIVDPHGDYLADAKAKLLALAAYAEQYGERFVRIDSIAKSASGSLRRLDLLDAKTRAFIRSFPGGKVTAIYESAVSATYQ